MQVIYIIFLRLKALNGAFDHTYNTRIISTIETKTLAQKAWIYNMKYDSRNCVLWCGYIQFVLRMLNIVKLTSIPESMILLYFV